MTEKLKSLDRVSLSLMKPWKTIIRITCNGNTREYKEIHGYGKGIHGYTWVYKQFRFREREITALKRIDL